eukprot:Skav227940  [mRNA]  locus=scaffold146:511992:513062:+ [translate_table: standard]
MRRTQRWGPLPVVIGAWWLAYSLSCTFLVPHLRPGLRGRSRVAKASSAGSQSQAYQVGDEVLTYYEEDCMWYPGRILSIDLNGSYSYLVKWDVPEDGIEEIRVTAAHMRCALIPIQKLEIGQQFTGVVSVVTDVGAFVDIGAEEEGLLPITMMAKSSWIDSAEDVLEEGQTVNVWISTKKDGHFTLTMVKDLIGPDLTHFVDISPDEWVNGVVTSLSLEGAFVSVCVDGVTADGFLHVSELSTSFVSSVQQVLSEGQAVRVRVLSVDIETGRMILSMKPPHSPTETQSQGIIQSRLAALSINQWIQGKVVRLIKAGAFVAVNPATAPAFSDGGVVEGLLHHSEMSLSATWLRNEGW